MCRGTLAVLVLVSYCIAVGTTFSIPEYGNDVYSIPPVERNDTGHVIGRSSSMNINFHDFILVDYINITNSWNIITRFYYDFL